jgi:c-di-GMP-binding flagellar brake protein YcgR
MTLLNILTLYPLQVSVTDMAWKSPESTGKETVIILVFFAVLIVFVVFINLLKSKGTGTKTGSGSGSVSGKSTGLFARLAMHKMASDIGLNNEQIKMLDFVFKTDQVLDPEKSITTPALLDRHFRRAYRVIEQTSRSDEEIQYRHSVLFSTRNLLESRVSGGLTSTRQLKDDNSIILNTGKEKYEVSVLSTSGESLAVECPQNALGSSIKMPKGNRINALLFTKNNKGFSFETYVTGYTTVHGRSAMLIPHSNKLKFLSQRRFRRRQMAIASNLYLVYVEGSGKKQRLVVDKRRLTGTIADISVGGCSIKAKAPVQVGARMKIEFTHGDCNVAALGQVLRTNRSGMVTVIHIKFLKVSRKSMNYINAFVYEYANE